MRVAASGGTPTELTHLTSGQIGHRWPQFLPDGRRFLFFAVGPPAMEGVYMASLDAGEATRVLAADSAAEYAPPGYLLVVSQGALVAHLFDAARGVVSGDPGQGPVDVLSARRGITPAKSRGGDSIGSSISPR
jgi:hypothetical protein